MKLFALITMSREVVLSVVLSKIRHVHQVREELRPQIAVCTNKFVTGRPRGRRDEEIPLTMLETRPVDETDEKLEMNFADVGRDVQSRSETKQT
jgi:hypothetical protein